MAMESNADKKRENYLTVCRWREGKSLDELSRYIQRRKDGDVYRYSLSRGKINNELKIGSAINQNPLIREVLEGIEKDMREAGILPSDEPVEPSMDDYEGVTTPSVAIPPDQGGLSATERERLNRLEEENAFLREELNEKNAALKRYGLIDRFLTDTMRLPR